MAAPAGYSHYKDIDVQDANIDGNLTNVPTLIQIGADSDIGGNIVDDTNGHDIRFYDVTTDAILYYDRVYFNVAAGDCNATFYVKCPALYATPSDDQNNIRIYYGKAADSDGEDKANTWSDYIAVWHMADASGTITDATGNHPSTSETITAYQAAGRVRYACEFDGSSDGAVTADAAAFDTGTFSVQAWCDFDALSAADYIVRRCDSNGGAGGTYEGFWMNSNGSNPNEYCDFNVADDGALGDGRTGSGTLTTGTWYWCSGTIDSNGIVLAYVNSTVGSNTHDWGGGITMTGEEGVSLGCSSVGSNVHDGHMEEVRYANDALSANHIKFEYNNMDSTVNADYELTWGAEQSTGGAAYTIECTPGTYAITGANLNALYGRKAICTTGTYAVTGKTLNALVGYKAICTTGTYAITGKTLNALVGYKAICTTGAYLVTGKTLEATYNENVLIEPAVFSVILTFNVPVITLGASIHGGVVHMFMDMSMN